MSLNTFENDKIEGAVLFLDFQKAFDTVNHNFMHTVLGHNLLNGLKQYIANLKLV